MTDSDRTNQNEGESFANQRRTVLKALGAGSGLALMSGVGAADGHNDQEPSKTRTSKNSDCWCPPCIDRLQGYTALADDDESEWPAQPDHKVDMYVEPRQVLFQQISTEETDVEPGATPGSPDEEEFPDFFFDPVGIHVETGAVVDFYNESDALHTVTAFDTRFSEPPYFEPPQRIPDDAPPFSSPPVMADEHWLYRFDAPGVYDLFCLPHLGLGMVVRVVVGEGDFTEPESTDTLPVAEQTVFGTPEMSVEAIIEQGSVAWDDLTIEEKLDPDTLFAEEGGE